MSKLLKQLLLIIILILSNFTFAKGESLKKINSSFDKRFVVYSTKDTQSNIILDKQSGLLWQDQRTVINRLFYANTANNYCSNMNLGSLNHWRVPTYHELMSLIDYQKSEPATSAPFVHQSIGDFWTSTPSVKDPKYYWYIDFLYGYTSISPMGKPLLLRCVHNAI